MFDFYEKRKMRGYLYSYGTIFVLLLVCAGITNAAYHRYVVAEEMKHKLEEKRDDLRTLETRAQTLDAEITYLKDSRGIEEELRTRFDVAKEGEEVVILVRDSLTQDAQTETVPEEATSTPSFLDTLMFWR